VGCAIAQAVIYQLLTMGIRVKSQDSPCGIWAGQCDTGTGFSQSTYDSLASNHYTAPHTITEAGTIGQFKAAVPRDSVSPPTT
jgi:hypothetical protein